MLDVKQPPKARANSHGRELAATNNLAIERQPDTCPGSSIKTEWKTQQQAGFQFDLAAFLQPGVTTDYIDKKVHQMIIENNAYPSPLTYGEHMRCPPHTWRCRQEATGTQNRQQRLCSSAVLVLSSPTTLVAYRSLPQERVHIGE